MLQQTQVATVVPYFHRFVERFPTLADLGAATEQEVLRLWQGLGYYRRARHLHAAARAAVAEHGGKLPQDVDDLLKLPGVGRYTAGAVASIAFGKRAALVDGNVKRVLARLMAIRESVDDRQTDKRIWELAEELVPAERPGGFNQAMMELGAVVCLPRGPRCGECPASRWCAARKQGLEQTLPIRASRRKPRAVEHHMLAIERDGQWLFMRRLAKGLWAGMWQMPTVEQQSMTGRSLAAWAGKDLGLKVTTPVKMGNFAHQTTHRLIHFTLWRCRALCEDRVMDDATWRCLGPMGTADLPVSNPQRRAVALLEGSR